MRSDHADGELLELMKLIAADDVAGVLRRLETRPALAGAVSATGATRANAQEFFLSPIQHYINAGDTALHVAAAGFRTPVVQALLRQNADPTAANRRAAQPLHYACDTNTWNPDAQVATIRCLIEAGAPVNAPDANGATPLHRAVRTRSAPAVQVLLDHGASPHDHNGGGSTPLHLAVQNTGRGGSGSPRAREQQELIISALLRRGAELEALDGRGRTVRDAAASDEVRRRLGAVRSQ